MQFFSDPIQISRAPRPRALNIVGVDIALTSAGLRHSFWNWVDFSWQRTQLAGFGQIACPV